MHTIADLMAETLHSAGIRRVCGVAGDSLNGFTGALRRQKDVEWVHRADRRKAKFS